MQNESADLSTALAFSAPNHLVVGIRESEYLANSEAGKCLTKLHNTPRTLLVSVGTENGPHLVEVPNRDWLRLFSDVRGSIAPAVYRALDSAATASENTWIAASAGSPDDTAALNRLFASRLATELNGNQLTMQTVPGKIRGRTWSLISAELPEDRVSSLAGFDMQFTAGYPGVDIVLVKPDDPSKGIKSVLLQLPATISRTISANDNDASEVEMVYGNGHYLEKWLKSSADEIAPQQILKSLVQGSTDLNSAKDQLRSYIRAFTQVHASVTCRSSLVQTAKPRQPIKRKSEWPSIAPSADPVVCKAWMTVPGST